MGDETQLEDGRTQRDEEEATMRRKFPTAAAGRNALLEKRLSRGGQKYFDSGDYNMVKAATDPKHKSKLNLGYPLAVPNINAGPKSPSVAAAGAHSPLSFSPVNPLTPPTTPTEGAMSAIAASPTESAPPARPPSSIDLYHRRLSRQQSRLACEIEAFTDFHPEAARV